MPPTINRASPTAAAIPSTGTTNPAASPTAPATSSAPTKRHAATSRPELTNRRAESPVPGMPAVGALVPIYILAQTAGLLDTRLVLIIVFTLSNLPIMVWMLYSSFREIPHEILEAARMDGATVWQEFRRVLLPLGMGGLFSTGLLCLVLAWNEAFWSLNLSSAKAGTLAALIASYSSPEGLFWAKLSCASFMAIAPIVVFGWFCQRQLVQGLTFGAVK